MVKILLEADKTPVAEVAKKHGVREGTLYVWRRRFGTMEVADTKKLKALEAENTRLKKMVADRDLARTTRQTNAPPLSPPGSSGTTDSGPTAHFKTEAPSRRSRTYDGTTSWEITASERRV